MNRTEDAEDDADGDVTEWTVLVWRGIASCADGSIGPFADRRLAEQAAVSVAARPDVTRVEIREVVA